MANFYVKQGAGSLNLDGKVYNEGDLVETTKTIAKTLANVLTSTKPTVDESTIKEPVKAPKTTLKKEEENKGDEINDVIEVTIPDLENEGKELIIDVVSCERADLEKVSNAIGVSFPWNIGDPKLREKIIVAINELEKED